ncbi:type II secretion system protein [Peribacillus asahii]|uniref:type II secretion system protein n=1 Tax=Peribacillus asahii TaxID=228899 RepID=UPI0038042810
MKKKLQKLLKNQKGLTLVELLAVVVILGIIAAIAVPSIGKIIDNSKKDAHIANAEQLVGAARLAVAANDKGLWVGKEDTTKKYDSSTNITMKELVDAGYLESLIEDPDSNAAYTAAYVVYSESDNSYSVYIDGSKRDVTKTAGSAVPVLASELSRDSVK